MLFQIILVIPLCIKKIHLNHNLNYQRWLEFLKLHNERRRIKGCPPPLPPDYGTEIIISMLLQFTTFIFSFNAIIPRCLSLGAIFNSLSSHTNILNFYTELLIFIYLLSLGWISPSNRFFSFFGQKNILMSTIFHEFFRVEIMFVFYILE